MPKSPSQTQQLKVYCALVFELLLADLYSTLMGFLYLLTNKL